MFREASAIDSERTAASVRSLYAKYSGNENWFDGTPDSVDRRIAQAKKIGNAAKAACVRLSGRNVVSQYIALAHEMDTDRAALEGLRRDLLTGAVDRDDEPVFELSVRDPHINPDGHHRPKYSEEPHDGGEDNENAGYNMSAGQGRTALRSDARHFIAEQECNDLRELTIRAKHYAERVASTLPAHEAASLVRSFVGAVRSEYEPTPRQYRTAATDVSEDFPADFLYLE